MPLLILVENNGVSQSTPIELHLAGSIADRFAAFGIPVTETVTHRPEQLGIVLAASIDAVRNGEGPQAVIVSVQRLCGHSVNSSEPSGDAADDLDPLTSLEKRLHPDEVQELTSAAEADVRRIVAAYSDVEMLPR